MRTKKFPHEVLKERLNDLMKFRQDHESLKTVVTRILSFINKQKLKGVEKAEESPLSSTALQDIQIAYQIMSSCDLLDLSEEGKKIFEQYKTEYNTKIDKIEQEITYILKQMLTDARSHNEI